MAYASSTNLTDRYGTDFVARSFDRDGNGSADSTVVARALDDATAEIDTYLASRYALPLVIVPAVLTRICGDIAIYRGSAEAGCVTDEKRRRYDDALKWLEAVAKGIVSLGTSTEPETVSGSATLHAPNARLFTREKMRGL